MLAGVITTPKRQNYLYDLIPMIAPEVDKFFIFNDIQHQGQVFNLRRCMATLLPMAKQNEPVLIMTDDVMTTPDWKARFEKIHLEAKHDIYTFFTRRPNHAKFAEQGWGKGVFPRGFYDQAVIYINQQDLIPKIDKWFEERGKEIMPLARQKHYDVVIQDYLVDNNIEWVVTVPTLFEHVGDVSVLGHSIGRSINYAGDNENL